MPTHVYLRPIRPSDGGDIAIWFQDAETRQRMGGMLPLDRWLAFVLDAPAQQVWLAEDHQHRTIGLIQVEWETPERAWISLIVHPAWRQRGYSKEMLHLITAELCKQSVREICCEVATDNIASLRSMKRQGFVIDTHTVATTGFLAYTYHCAGR